METNGKILSAWVEDSPHIFNILLPFFGEYMMEQFPVIRKVKGFLDLSQIPKNIGNKKSSRNSFLVCVSRAILIAAGELSMPVTSNPFPAR